MPAAAFFLHIHRWIHIVYILLIQFFPKKLKGFTESLEVDDLTLAQEFDYVVHIRIIAQPKNVIVSDSCLLFWERIP